MNEVRQNPQAEAYLWNSIGIQKDSVSFQNLCNTLQNLFGIAAEQVSPPHIAGQINAALINQQLRPGVKFLLWSHLIGKNEAEQRQINELHESFKSLLVRELNDIDPRPSDAYLIFGDSILQIFFGQICERINSSLEEKS